MGSGKSLRMSKYYSPQCHCLPHSSSPPTHAAPRQRTRAGPGDMAGNDMVYVSGLPDTVTEADLSAIFGAIGQLKFDKKKGCDKARPFLPFKTFKPFTL